MIKRPPTLQPDWSEFKTVTMVQDKVLLFQNNYTRKYTIISKYGFLPLVLENSFEVLPFLLMNVIAYTHRVNSRTTKICMYDFYIQLHTNTD